MKPLTPNQSKDGSRKQCDLRADAIHPDSSMTLLFCCRTSEPDHTVLGRNVSAVVFHGMDSGNRCRIHDGTVVTQYLKLCSQRMHHSRQVDADDKVPLAVLEVTDAHAADALADDARK